MYKKNLYKLALNTIQFENLYLYLNYCLCLAPGKYGFGTKEKRTNEAMTIFLLNIISSVLFYIWGF